MTIRGVERECHGTTAERMRRGLGLAMLVGTLIAYAWRPLSCGEVLRSFSPHDPVPYSHFDYHGVGSMGAMASALIYAAPMAWLAFGIYTRRIPGIGLFGPAENWKTTLGSILIALVLGAPTVIQLGYLTGLPASLTRPVLLSCIAWLVLVEIGRTAAVRGTPLSDHVVERAKLLAWLVAVPKLIFLLIMFNPG